MSKRILLHICCGPCAIEPARELADAGFEITGLFYNPNIHPAAEYLRRREGVAQVAERLGFRVLFKDQEYDPAGFFRRAAFREENRCFYCYADRLERTAQIASRGGFDAFTTTLLYSKLQKHDAIARAGRDAAKSKSPFEYRDFRRGWKKGMETSKAWGIYRQDYCGCLYSELERRGPELKRAAQSDPQ